MKKRIAIGIDFGGTLTKVGLVDEAGSILDRSCFATAEAPSPPEWLNRIESAISGFKPDRRRIAGIGAGMPGFVDFKRGFIHQLTNIPGWQNEKIAQKLSTRFKTPAFIDNDVNAMALGECTFGAGREYSDAFFVTLGTGVGGAVYINGALYRGAHSMAGEIGHVPILMNGRKTREGRGGLEVYVGVKNITRMAMEGLRSGRKSLIADLSQGKAEHITPKLICDAARAGDPLALEIFDKIADRLATAFAGVTYLIQPEVIIVGGGISNCGRPLFNPLRSHLNERLNPIFASRVSVRHAALGENAGLIGCACLALQASA
jgi:glucokinase